MGAKDYEIRHLVSNLCTFQLIRAYFSKLVHISIELCIKGETCAHFEELVHIPENSCTNLTKSNYCDHRISCS